MSIRKKLREESEVSIGPLNDILFILLLFFLIVSTLANPNVIKLSLPKSNSDTKSKQSIVVSIDANNQLYIGTEKVSMRNFESSLSRSLQKETLSPSVVINADKKATVEDVVFVMRTARKLGAATALSVDNSQ
ncbi:MAG: ExbD/TolR family protein [Chitinophagaceae bacterium]